MSFPFSSLRPSTLNDYQLPSLYKQSIARLLDLMADAELQQGHHTRAEELAWRANDIRAEARS